jgi:hypothetical protein
MATPRCWAGEPGILAHKPVCEGWHFPTKLPRVERTPFARQLDLERVAGTPGRYRTDLSDAWNCPVVPHGGVVTVSWTRSRS